MLQSFQACMGDRREHVKAIFVEILKHLPFTFRPIHLQREGAPFGNVGGSEDTYS